MANYEVTITNGTGSQAMQAGTYTVTATAEGYDTSTLSPTTFTATGSTATQAFTISASGTLTFIVNETGAEGGTAITGGTIIMTDSTGTTEYGEAVSINSNGEAVFNNVPYGSADTPFTLYFKQLTSDGDHNIYDGVITVTMTGQTQTEYIENGAIAEQTFTLTDSTYSLPVNGSLNFSSDD